MKLVTAEQMQAIDRNAIETLGMPGSLLMENAGRAAATEILDDATVLFPGPVLVLAGAGNNGGDGYVIARILADRGWEVQTLVLTSPRKISGDAKLMLEILQRLDGQVEFIDGEQELQSALDQETPAIVVDALLGTGLRSDVRGLIAQAISWVNQSGAQVIAVDIPSGVNGSDGRIMGAAVNADLTLTFDSAKVGHASRPGADHVGELRVLDIGIPQVKREPADLSAELVDAGLASSLLPQRPAAGHKGTFGHLGLVAGSRGMTGAAALSCDAGLRGGAGLVTLACPAGLHDILEVKLTEVMTRPLAGGRECLLTQNVKELLSLSEGWQAMVVGPGLGQNPQTVEAVRGLVGECSVPMLLDADGLNALCGEQELLRSRPASAPPLILTPHPGELSRLSGLSISEIEADRYRTAQRFARDYGVVLLLKGSRTLIADPGGRVRINPSGNVGLATGGSGDVLSGLIGSLLAQGLNPFDAASLGAWLHGAAADLLCDEYGCSGYLAGDVCKSIPIARQQLEGVAYVDC